MTTGVKAAAIAAALGGVRRGAIADAALGLEVSGTTAEHVGEVSFRNRLLLHELSLRRASLDLTIRVEPHREA